MHGNAGVPVRQVQRRLKRVLGKGCRALSDREAALAGKPPTPADASSPLVALGVAKALLMPLYRTVLGKFLFFFLFALSLSLSLSLRLPRTLRLKSCVQLPCVPFLKTQDRAQRRLSLWTNPS